MFVPAASLRPTARLVAGGTVATATACSLRLPRGRGRAAQVNARVYPCEAGLVNDPQTPWARCLPAELCGHPLYAPACALGPDGRSVWPPRAPAFSP